MILAIEYRVFRTLFVKYWYFSQILLKIGYFGQPPNNLRVHEYVFIKNSLLKFINYVYTYAQYTFYTDNIYINTILY